MGDNHLLCLKRNGREPESWSRDGSQLFQTEPRLLEYELLSPLNDR